MPHMKKEFMCGTPLAYDGVRYNLIDYDAQKGVQTSKFLLFSNDKWTQIPIMEFMDETYKVSEPYLKKYAFSILNPEKNAPINWNGAIKLIQDSMDSGKMHWVQQLFSSCVKLYGENKKSFDKDSYLCYCRWFGYTEYDNRHWVSIRIETIYHAGYHAALEDVRKSEEDKYAQSCCNPAVISPGNLNYYVSDLRITMRTHNLLARAGYKTVQELMRIPYDDLLTIHGIGISTAKEIAHALREAGFEYYGGEDD